MTCVILSRIMYSRMDCRRIGRNSYYLMGYKTFCLLRINNNFCSVIFTKRKNLIRKSPFAPCILYAILTFDHHHHKIRSQYIPIIDRPFFKRLIQLKVVSSTWNWVWPKYQLEHFKSAPEEVK